MRVPLSWLKEYATIDVPVEELAHRLTLAGLEVAALEYLGVPAADEKDLGPHLAVPISRDHLVWDREKVVVGHVLEVKPHPNADRLTLAMVDDGSDQVHQVVNGASNLMPYEDAGPIDPPLVVAYAREGAELLDPYADDWPQQRMTLTPRKLRGIENKSMVLSEKELGVSDAHEGIMLLQTDADPGTPLQDVLGDVILDLDLTPNLARCYSILGVAREVAALLDTDLRDPDLDVQMDGEPIAGQVALDIREPELNPRFMLTLIKDVEIGPSPDWLQRRLRKAGMRSINNIVDITNYVMLETGQPLHAFDYDILVERAGGKPPTIITRTAEEGETLVTLDDVERTLDDFTELVADTAGALSIAGVMGGDESEVHDESQTVLLESANWNLINIRRTLQAQRERGHEVNSEAGARFSRGVHPAQARVGLLRATELIRELAGGTVAEGVLDDYPQPAPQITVDLSLEEVDRILGIELTAAEVSDILTRLQFEVQDAGDHTLHVTVPDHRLDIGYVNDPAHGDIVGLVGQADLIEEIARIYGYDRIPDTLIRDELPPQRTNLSLVREEALRDVLVRAGLQEVTPYRLTTPEAEARLTPPGAESSLPDAGYVRLANPISQERTVMRHSLLNSLLEVAADNARWQTRQALFEIGKVYLGVEGQELPDEQRRLGLLMTGERALPAWQDPTDHQPELMDYYDLKGVVETAVADMHIEEVHFEPAEHSTFFPGRVARLLVGGDEVGVLGQLHPLVQEAYNLPDQPVLLADLNLEALLAHVSAMHQVRPIANYPAIYQDIAVVVDEDVPAADVEQTIQEAGGWLLRGVRLFDVYRGDQIGAGKKSLAYALIIQSTEKTLRDRDADTVRANVVRALEEQYDAHLRE